MYILRKNVCLMFCCYKHTRTKCDFFITTPIYYVNSSPHIGHLYSSLLADASHRYHNLLGKSRTVFSAGTDEHGTKVQQAAASSGTPLPDFCDSVAHKYRQMNVKYDISCTNFVRTTNTKHIIAVSEFWKELSKRNHISSGTYKGWYCDADEAFLTDHQIQIVKDNNGNEIRLSAESGRPVSWVEEQNYKFHLSRFKSDLKEWLKSDRSIQPEKFRRQVLQWIDENGLADEDISISRPKSRVHWAIPVPGDDTQTVYVWLDALVNYLTIMGYPELSSWPPAVQVIGKDILKFHALYWPAFLIAAGLEPPSTLMVHSHWTVDGEKMSKSKGNVVCPFKAVDRYGINAMRYFLLREGTPHSDSNYSDVKLLRVVNSELADTFGNLLSRCCGCTINQQQKFPPFIEEDFNLYCREQAKDLITILNSLSVEVGQYYLDFHFYKGIALIMSALREANRHFEFSRPWELRKSRQDEDVRQLNILLYLTMETLRVCGIILSPIVPDLSKKLLDKLNIPIDQRSWTDAIPTWNKKSNNVAVDLHKDNVVLFKRVEL